MGVIAQNYYGSSTPLSQVKGEELPQTIFNRVTAPIFNILDAPANALRSIATGRPINALQSLIPFAGSERISGEEVLETYGVDQPGPITSLAVEVFVDPLLFVNSIGQATKFGKALNKVADAKIALEVAQKSRGKLAKISDAADELRGSLTALAEAKFKAGPKRSIIEVGLPFSGKGKEIGDWKKVSDTFAKLDILPDVRTPIMKVELAKTVAALQRVESSGSTSKKTLEKIEELTKKSARLTADINGLRKGVIPVNVATTLRNSAESFAAKFGHGKRNPRVAALINAGTTRTAELNYLVGEDKTALISTMDTLAETQGISKLAQATRLMGLGETPKILPDIVKMASEETMNVFHKYAKQINKIVKDGKVTDPEKAAKIFGNMDEAVQNVKFKLEKRRLQLNEFEKINGAAIPQEIAVLDMLTSHLEDGVAKAQYYGFDIDELGTAKGMLSYMPRILSPEALALKKTNSVKFSLMMSEAKGFLPSAIKRKVFPEMSMREINEYTVKHYGIPLFNEDPILAITKYRLDMNTALGKAEMAHTAVKMFAQKGLPTSESVAVFGGKKSFLWETGLKRQKGLPERMGLGKGYRIPKSIYNDLMGTNAILQKSVFNNLPNLVKAIKVMDDITTLVFRLPLTVLFPEFHNRNWLSNVLWQNPSAGITLTKNFDDYKEAGKLQLAWLRGTMTPEQQKWYQELVAHGAMNKGFEADLRNMFDQFKVGGKELPPAWKEFIERPLSILGQKRRESLYNLVGIKVPKEIKRDFDIGFGRAWGQFIEDNARITHYMVKRKAGATPIEAMRSMNKYLYDYTKMTNFEKQYVKPAFMFYGWMRNNIPRMIQSSITEPRMASVYGHLTGLNEDEVPYWLKGSRAFMSPFSPNEAIGTLGLPIEDVNIFNVADADPNIFNQMKRIADRVISKTVPAIKFPWEIATGRTTFTNKPLEHMTGIELFKEFSPFSRFVRTGAKITSDEPTGSKMLDLLTGIRSYKIDPSSVKIEREKRKLLSTGKFERHGFLITKKAKYKTDEEAKQDLKELNKLIRQRNK